MSPHFVSLIQIYCLLYFVLLCLAISSHHLESICVN